MNRKFIFYTLGQIFTAAAGMLILPVVVAVIYRESSIWAFITVAGASLIFGQLLKLVFKTHNKVIYAKEGFVIVALAWLCMSLIGAVPFVLSGEIPSYFDAFFETVSGFTTTGASILRNVEGLSRSVLFWRSFTHWIGGMGVLVFIMALMSGNADRSIHILRAEMPGPVVGKLVPKARDTAKILYLIYIAMTGAEIIFLLLGGMPVFDSIVHSFATAGTGGFGIKADSIGGYSAYTQWVIAVFMILFGVNFNVYYLMLVRKVNSMLKSTELWCYLSIVVMSIGLVTMNVYSIYGSFSESLRQSTFQVASIISTTGFATADFNAWPGLSKTILLLLMFVGGCAGSTAGGLKVSRVMLLIKTIRREIKKLIHPNIIKTVRLEYKPVEESTLSGVTSYFAIYILCIAIVFLILSLEPFNMETNFSATIACFNNVGPGLAGVGPTSNYADYSNLSKVVLSLAMLLGRLEIFPIVIALNPFIWKKRV
ncbi:MAG: TrkH family potassium uptake protein [Clostridiales bacterium]|nr:TrkH family potassium uptake protein [Clostridiales bacterium]